MHEKSRRSGNSGGFFVSAERKLLYLPEISLILDRCADSIAYEQIQREGGVQS